MNAASPPRWLSPAARRGWLVLWLALLALVTWLALSPAPPPQADTGWDKANHALAFAVLAIVGAFSRWTAPARDLRLSLGLLAYGALIELAQSQLPPRSGEWGDWLADALGIAIGLGASAAVAAWLRRRARTVKVPSP